MDITDIFTDFLNTDLSDFDIKKENYRGNSLAKMVKLVISNKEMLNTLYETNKEQNISFNNDKILIITDKDIKILNDCHIFKGPCANCNDSKRKDDETKGLLRCNGCKLVRYCSSDCQLIDWKNHKMICKRLIKAMCSDDEIINIDDD